MLSFYLSLMAGLLAFAHFFPEPFRNLLNHDDWYLQAKFVHVVSVTLFFANVIIGTIWEWRSLRSKREEIIRYTYQTVTWLDAVFTAPLVILAVISGIMLATILGGVWNIGWVSTAFSLFLLSGMLWIIADIPTQYLVKRLFASMENGACSIPLRLTRLLWLRMLINLVSIVPLTFIFYLMVNKPEMPTVGRWLKFKTPAPVQLSRRGPR